MNLLPAAALALMLCSKAHHYSPPETVAAANLDGGVGQLGRQRRRSDAVAHVLTGVVHAVPAAALALPSVVRPARRRAALRAAEP